MVIHTFELGNPKKLITDEEQEIINNESHPYGLWRYIS